MTVTGKLMLANAGKCPPFHVSESDLVVDNGVMLLVHCAPAIYNLEITESMSTAATQLFLPGPGTLQSIGTDGVHDHLFGQELATNTGKSTMLYSTSSCLDVQARPHHLKTRPACRWPRRHSQEMKNIRESLSQARAFKGPGA